MSLIKVFPPQKFFFFVIGLLKNFLCRKHCYLFLDAADGFHVVAYLGHIRNICAYYFYYVLFQSNSVQMYQNLLFENCLNWNLKLQNLGEYNVYWTVHHCSS